MKRRTHLLAAAAALALLTAGCSGDDDSKGSDGSGDGGGDAVKIGFITKFPVDFYDTMVDAAKEWDAGEDGAEVLYAQGKSGTDDEGEIAAIQSFVTQQVDAIVITPTSPNVQDDLQKAVDAGIEVILVDNDIPDWDGKTSVVATDNLAGGELAGTVAGREPARGSADRRAAGRARQPVARRPRDRHDGDAGRRRRGRRRDADRLRPDQGTRRRPGHPHRAPRHRRRSTQRAVRRCSAPSRPSTRRGSSGLITVGFDASPDELAAIAAGTESASVAQFPDKMGSMGVQAAFDALNGKDVPATIDTGTEMVTEDNVADFQ